MKEIIREHNATYNLRNNNGFVLQSAKTVSYGTETIKYRGRADWPVRLAPSETSQINTKLLNFAIK